ncbi:MAG: Rpn family recombination-promoting nuclease/putative transposase, partial [Spirochaetaceae bacterium]|nr:Rpn family recombination-promoting nuclease/putative transposase [Spirochaetaceae bacterium]
PERRFNLLNDYLFLKVMGEKGDEEQLLGFLNAVLQKNDADKLVSVEILEDKTFSPEVIGDKSSILDLRARTDGNRRVNIEVQIRNLGNMDKRSLFYWSREYSKSLEAGRDYSELPNVVAINIVNFEFIRTENFHCRFHLWEDSDRTYMLTDALEIHFVDMVKFRRIGEKDVRNDPLQRWLSYFDPGSPKSLVEEAMKMDVSIRKAEEKLALVSSDKEALRAYQMREMALSDWTSGVNFARSEGLNEGLRKGIQQGRMEGRMEGLNEGLRKGRMESRYEIAGSFKDMGISVDQIAQATGLSPDEIAKL